MALVAKKEEQPLSDQKDKKCPGWDSKTVAKADNKPIDDNQLNLKKSNNLFVKAKNLWFTAFEPTPLFRN
jgi:hypothetical protein